MTADFSLLSLLGKANQIVTHSFPGAVPVQIVPLQHALVPTAYKFWFRIKDTNKDAVISYDELWSGISTTTAILGVGGDLMTCKIDIEQAIQLVRQAGYKDDMFLCNLIKAVDPSVKEPNYTFTPDTCSYTDPSHYIFVGAITGKVSLFPKSV